MKKILYITLVFMLCFTLFMPVSHALTFEEMPDLPSSTYPYNYYIVDTNGNNDKIICRVFSSNEAFTLNAIASSSTSIAYTPLNVDGERVQVTQSSYYLSGSTWDSPIVNRSDYFATSSKGLYYSDVDIYNTDGTIFFQGPPTELYRIIQALTAEEMTKQSLTLVGTMKILTVCGIGLLALLIGLVVFGKVFRVFQVK